jgi:hypothetical protein
MAEKTIGQIAYEAMQKSEGGFRWDWERSVKRPHWEVSATAVWNEAVEACIKAATEYLNDGDWDQDTCEAIGNDLRSIKRSDKENGDG